MQLEELKTLFAVVQHGGFNTTARRTNQSPSTISKHVKNLEADCGVALLDRSGRRVVPTPAGRAVIEEALPAVTAIDRCPGLARRIASGEAERLRVGHSSASALDLLERCLSASTAFSNLQLQLSEAPTDELTVQLLDSRLDVALLRPPLNDPQLAEQHLLDETLVAVVPRGHALAQRTSVAVASLASSPFVLPPTQQSRHGRDVVTSLCERAGGFTPTTVHEAGTTAGILTLVAAGVGVSILPRHYGFRYGVRGVRSLRLTGSELPRLPLHAAWRRTDSNPAILQFRTALAEAIPSFRSRRQQRKPTDVG